MVDYPLIMSRILMALMIYIASASSVSAAPKIQALPVEKIGNSCPVGYFNSGVYCMPRGDKSRFALRKIGNTCPSGYYNSGSYCVASSDRSKFAMPRIRYCPIGYMTSGNYCLSNR